MNQILSLKKRLEERFPNAKIVEDAPTSPNGDAYLNITLADQFVTVVWNATHGFGITARDDVVYGESADEQYSTADEAFTKITRLLLARSTTTAPEQTMLSALRKERQVSQVELAERLHIQQAAVSKLERRDNMHISTLRNIIEAMGGKLEVRAVFPDGIVRVIQFDSVVDDEVLHP